jgi:hypothetical protein
MSMYVAVICAYNCLDFVADSNTGAWCNLRPTQGMLDQNPA